MKKTHNETSPVEAVEPDQFSDISHILRPDAAVMTGDYSEKVAQDVSERLELYERLLRDVAKVLAPFGIAEIPHVAGRNCPVETTFLMQGASDHRRTYPLNLTTGSILEAKRLHEKLKVALP